MYTDMLVYCKASQISVFAMVFMIFATSSTLCTIAYLLYFLKEILKIELYDKQQYL